MVIIGLFWGREGRDVVENDYNKWRCDINKVRKSLEKRGDIVFLDNDAKEVVLPIQSIVLIFVKNLVCRSSPYFYLFIEMGNFRRGVFISSFNLLVMPYNFINAPLIFQYLLMMAPTLVCSSCLHQKRHL